MKSSIVKRSIVLDGHKTSISLEDEFWSSLRDIARSGETTLSQLIAESMASETRATFHPLFGFSF